MIGRYLLIKDDLFSIAKRLKEIDKSYFVVYSYKKRRYEVHSPNDRGSTLCFALPYDRLDARAITYARRTRRERAQRLYEELERENAAIYKQEREKVCNDAARQVERIFSRGEI